LILKYFIHSSLFTLAKNQDHLTAKTDLESCHKKHVMRGMTVFKGGITGVGRLIYIIFNSLGIVIVVSELASVALEFV